MIPRALRLRLSPTPVIDHMRVDRLRAAIRHVLWLLRSVFLSPLLLRPRRRAPSPSRVRRILVLRTDRLGDMVLSTPALADLRSQYRDATISVLAPPASLELLRGHPAVDHLVPLTREGLSPAMRGRYDLAIDLSSDEGLRGALLAHRSAARARIGLSAYGRQAFFSLRGPAVDRTSHVLEQNRAVIAALGVPTGDTGPSLHLSAEERGQAQMTLASLGAASPRVVLHIGGHYPSQRWSPERFAELIGLLTGRTGAACVVLCCPGEDGLAARVLAATPDALIAPSRSVRAMMALIASCDLFIGNNSGPLHVAGALGLPTISMMGPTDARRFGPRGPADHVLRRNLACSPCRRASCWHHSCLRDIEPEEVLAEAEAVLARIRPREMAR